MPDGVRVLDEQPLGDAGDTADVVKSIADYTNFLNRLNYSIGLPNVEEEELWAPESLRPRGAGRARRTRWTRPSRFRIDGPGQTRIADVLVRNA